MKWVLDRLGEKTTWMSIFTVLGTVIGVSVAPEMKEAIIETGMGITALILVIIKEKK